MSRIWYTSDLHIGHRLVAGIRGFEDVAEHDAALVDSWLSTVNARDTVYVLGDVAVSGYSYALDIVKALPGRKHLIAGNHDPVHPMHRQTFAPKFAEWADVFATISPFGRRRLAGREVLLSHFPYAEWGDGPERDGNRYAQYRLPDLGVPLLHGHTHGTEREHGHSLHVGLDAWGMGLVDQEVVIEWLNEKEKS